MAFANEAPIVAHRYCAEREKVTFRSLRNLASRVIFCIVMRVRSVQSTIRYPDPYSALARIGRGRTSISFASEVNRKRLQRFLECFP